jgi:Ni/Fe-hydrogenase subunit HybB-like protein
MVPAFRRNNSLLMASLAFIVMGLVINCWNVTLSGLVVPPDWSPGIMGNIFTD